MNQFNQDSTTADVIAGHSLSGRTALITGASSGLGVETARCLASAGARVIMSARDSGKLNVAADSVRAAEAEAEIETLVMDLAELGSVRAAAEESRRRFPEVHLLINNAGVMACPLARTADGFEMQFGTNHLGHFLFTCLIAPALIDGGESRIVNLSSAGHKFANVNLDDPNYLQRDYDKWQAYGESKTANALFSVALDERLAGRGVRSFAVHPGVILTDLGRHLSEADLQALSERSPGGAGLVFKSVEQGAATSVWAATSDDLTGHGGLYLENCQIGEPATAGSDSGVESYALDRDQADRLWRISEDLVGQSFEF